jgi:3-hydroxyacyl-[acyl-carrier-protein] dehydratase
VRYFLIDRIEELKKRDYAVGIKCISLSDDVFEHHFPGRPVYPGALLIEAMAQLGGALLEYSLMEPAKPIPRCVLSSVQSKFRGFAVPGDRIVFRAKAESIHEDAARVSAEGYVDERRICQADIIYVYLHIDDRKLEDSRREYLSLLTRHTRVIGE